MDWTESEFKKKIVITIIIIITIYLEDYPLVPGTERFVAKKSIFEKKQCSLFGLSEALGFETYTIIELENEREREGAKPGEGENFFPLPPFSLTR